MPEFKERLDEAMRIRDISAAELSRISKVNEGAISQYRAGKYKASQRSLDKLARALNVSIPWLMGADVPMTDESTAPTLPSPTIAEDAELNEYLEMLRTRPEMKMMFQLAKGATKEDVEKAVRVIEAMFGKDTKGD